MTIEYQGWATIREAFCEMQEDESRLTELVNDLQIRLSSLWQNAVSDPNNRGVKTLNPGKISMGQYVFENFNGTWRLSIIGSRNHISGDWPEILALFEWIAAEAPGSYGVLSVINHEDATSLSGAFDTYVLKRGHLIKTRDVYLSPFQGEAERL